MHSLESSNSSSSLKINSQQQQFSIQSVYNSSTAVVSKKLRMRHSPIFLRISTDGKRLNLSPRHKSLSPCFFRALPRFKTPLKNPPVKDSNLYNKRSKLRMTPNKLTKSTQTSLEKSDQGNNKIEIRDNSTSPVKDLQLEEDSSLSSLATSKSRLEELEKITGHIIIHKFFTRDELDLDGFIQKVSIKEHSLFSHTKLVEEGKKVVGVTTETEAAAAVEKICSTIKCEEVEDNKTNPIEKEELIEKVIVNKSEACSDSNDNANESTDQSNSKSSQILNENAKEKEDEVKASESNNVEKKDKIEINPDVLEQIEKDIITLENNEEIEIAASENKEKEKADDDGNSEIIELLVPILKVSNNESQTSLDQVANNNNNTNDNENNDEANQSKSTANIDDNNKDKNEEIKNDTDCCSRKDKIPCECKCETGEGESCTIKIEVSNETFSSIPNPVITIEDTFDEDGLKEPEFSNSKIKSNLVQFNKSFNVNNNVNTSRPIGLRRYSYIHLGPPQLAIPHENVIENCNNIFQKQLRRSQSFDSGFSTSLLTSTSSQIDEEVEEQIILPILEEKSLSHSQLQEKDESDISILDVDDDEIKFYLSEDEEEEARSSRNTITEPGQLSGNSKISNPRAKRISNKKRNMSVQTHSNYCLWKSSVSTDSASSRGSSQNDSMLDLQVISKRAASTSSKRNYLPSASSSLNIVNLNLSLENNVEKLNFNLRIGPSAKNKGEIKVKEAKVKVSSKSDPAGSTMNASRIKFVKTPDIVNDKVKRSLDRLNKANSDK